MFTGLKTTVLYQKWNSTGVSAQAPVQQQGQVQLLTHQEAQNQGKNDLQLDQVTCSPSGFVPVSVRDSFWQTWERDWGSVVCGRAVSPPCELSSLGSSEVVLLFAFSSG